MANVDFLSTTASFPIINAAVALRFSVLPRSSSAYVAIISFLVGVIFLVNGLLLIIRVAMVSDFLWQQHYEKLLRSAELHSYDECMLLVVFLVAPSLPVAFRVIVCVCVYGCNVTLRLHRCN
jgi:hypothetical protein